MVFLVVFCKRTKDPWYLLFLQQRACDLAKLVVMLHPFSTYFRHNEDGKEEEINQASIFGVGVTVNDDCFTPFCYDLWGYCGDATLLIFIGNNTRA